MTSSRVPVKYIFLGYLVLFFNLSFFIVTYFKPIKKFAGTV